MATKQNDPHGDLHKWDAELKTIHSVGTAIGAYIAELDAAKTAAITKVHAEPSLEAFKELTAAIQAYNAGSAAFTIYSGTRGATELLLNDEECVEALLKSANIELERVTGERNAYVASATALATKNGLTYSEGADTQPLREYQQTLTTCANECQRWLNGEAVKHPWHQHRASVRV